jgi:prepilin-type processing-associated H-X9-DG protein
METDFEYVAGGGGQDTDFHDASIYWQVASDDAEQGTLWAEKTGTGRRLDMFRATGKTLAKDFSTTEKLEVPMIPNGFGMNVSISGHGAKPWHLAYVDYKDWSAVTEPAFHIKDLAGNIRADDPREMVAYRHSGRANVGFVDGHVERKLPVALDRDSNPLAASIWHPERPPSWNPVPYGGQ